MEGFVGLSQREHGDLRANADFARDFQEITGIGAGHIGHAADYALAPEKFVVIKLGHVIQMNGVDCHYATFAKACQRADHHISAGGEGDGAIELDWRLFVFVSYPSSAERFRQLAMGHSSGCNVHFAFPGLQNGDGEACRRAEAEKADSFAGLDARDAQAAKSDDAGAEQRSDVNVVQAAG